MYRWMREIHMVAGLAFAPFALMYGISAVRMSHAVWFPSQPVVTVSHAAVAPEKATDARALARELMARDLIRGELSGVKATPEEYRFQLHRPGGSFNVTYSRRIGEARIEDETEGTMSTLVRLHHIASLNYGYWLNNAWGALLALTAVAFLTAAGTGVCMWISLPRERTLGLATLAAILAFTLTLLITIRTVG